MLIPVAPVIFPVSGSRLTFTVLPGADPARIHNLNTNAATSQRCAHQQRRSCLRPWNNYSSDMVDRIVDRLERRIDLHCVEIDRAQCPGRKTELSAARELH